MIFRYVEVNNGGYIEEYPEYKCNNCSRIQFDGDPVFSNTENDFHLCIDCAFKTGIFTEDQYINTGGLGGCEGATINKGNIILLYKKGTKIIEEMNDKELRKTSFWRNKRLEIISRDNNKCKICGSKERLHVHHIYKSKNVYEGFFEDYNLVTLCNSCHSKNHTNIRALRK